jgi:hypothetical protein
MQKLGQPRPNFWNSTAFILISLLRIAAFSKRTVNCLPPVHFTRQISVNPSLFPFVFHSRAVHLDIIRAFYLSTDAQENCFKKNVKICIKTAPTCFG